MVGDMDNTGSLNAQIIHQITDRVRSKFAFQVCICVCCFFDYLWCNTNALLDILVSIRLSSRSLWTGKEMLNSKGKILLPLWPLATQTSWLGQVIVFCFILVYLCSNLSFISVALFVFSLVNSLFLSPAVPPSLSGIVIAHYLQSVTPSLALGGELVYHRRPGEEGTVMSLAGRYTGKHRKKE